MQIFQGWKLRPVKDVFSILDLLQFKRQSATSIGSYVMAMSSSLKHEGLDFWRFGTGSSASPIQVNENNGR